MNREIKFRAWDKEKKKMRPVNSIAFHYEREDRDSSRLPKVVNMWGWDLIEDKAIIIHREIKDVVLMEFTGLKDKNGKEIWEGDVVSRFNDTQRSAVEFQDGCFFSILQKSGGSDPQYDILCNDLSVTEVIGNIYEHPELLKGG